MYHVYVLRSLKDNKHYIGYTNNLERRLQDHNRRKSISIRHRGPFELIHEEIFQTKLEAIHRERQIKSYKGGDAFKELLKEDPTPSSSLV
ncbi:MAG: GIY-YIG nuclease family protein [Candidatus Omnitrophota bacterium]|nr:GIY-YIG nuclease family protein [Candidatus Omnitrophota bacterium]